MNDTAPSLARSAAAVAMNAIRALDAAGIDPSDCGRFVHADGFADRIAGREPMYVSDLVDIGARVGIPASHFLKF